MKTHILALAVLLLAGCSGAVVFQADIPVPNGEWDRTWKPEFAFDIQDTISQRDIYLDIRHTGDYPFSNIYVFATLTGPQGHTLTDTVECTLADPTGRWYGKGAGFIHSDRVQAHVLYRMHNTFPASGRYTIALEQAMRTEKLTGVIDVGISIEASATRK
ncbi:MAG: gliding motility lipoprotein GldH [Flavobacteriales bacterium]|nr:gliding motility lipoprotein GldH [Flavobacteriales bacterium]